MNETTKEIIDIWYSAALPHMASKATYVKLSRYVDIMKKLKKSKKRAQFKTYCEQHISKYNRIFDICTCQCLNICTCIKHDRIPPIEVPFITDQRKDRLLYIDTTCTQGTSYQSRSSSKKIRLDVPNKSAAIASTSLVFFINNSNSIVITMCSTL